MFSFVVIIIAILALSFAINMLLLHSVGPFYRIFVIPGVVVHELSHAFACFITGAKVTGISMFKKEGGEVRHGRSSVPVLGPILISTAPFIIGAILIFLLSKLIGFKPINLIDFDFTPANTAFLVKTSFSSLNLAAVKTWIGLYLVLSIAITMIPSLQDMKNMLLSLIFIFIVVFIIIRYTNFRPDMSFLLRPELFVVLTSVLFLLTAALILSILIFAIKGMFNS
jgi:hypothetical protein